VPHPNRRWHPSPNSIVPSASIASAPGSGTGSVLPVTMTLSMLKYPVLDSAFQP
jgi:hypothetical protein